MSTNFPTSLDTLTNPASTDKQNSPSHSAIHANANDAIEALEAKVGVDGSIVATSLDKRVSDIESTAATVQSVSVVSANGLAGTVATATTTPAITLSTSITGILKGNGTAISAATAGVDYQAAGAYLTGVTVDSPLSGAGTSASHLTVDLSSKQDADAGLTSLAGLTYASTSFVKMTGADTFALDTNTYLTSLTGAVLTDQSTPQSIGATGARLTKLWAVDIESTNAPTAGGVAIPTISSTSTLTNKRITPRVVTTADDTTAVIDIDVTDQYQLTAMAGDTTISTTGTPVAGQKLTIRLKDDGTARALTWDAVFRAIGVTLPTTTVISKTVYIGCIYNSTDSKWDAVSVAQEA